MIKHSFLKTTALCATACAALILSGCVSGGQNAARTRDAARLQKILDRPNHDGEDLRILLDDSIWSGCVECSRSLLEAKALDTMNERSKSNALAYAAVLGHEKIAELLIDYGVETAPALSIVRSHVVMGFGYNQDQVQGAVELIQKAARQHDSRLAAPAAEVSFPVAAKAEHLQSRATPSFHQAERPDDYALIVGIERYDTLPAATYAERDAAAAADFVGALGVPPRNTAVLTGAHATRSGLAKQLEGWLANNVNERSTVYFYFSGHGAPDAASGQAYLVPFDGDPEYLDQTGYPLKRVYEKLGALKAKRVVVMLDSCFSGAGGRSVLAKGARPLVSTVDTGFRSADGKIVALTASGANQISGTDDEQGHGLFSYYLFSGLNGAAKDSSGQVTLNSLFEYLKPKVMDDAHRANREQVPQLQAGDTAAGETVLRAK